MDPLRNNSADNNDTGNPYNFNSAPTASRTSSNTSSSTQNPMINSGFVLNSQVNGQILPNNGVPQIMPINSNSGNTIAAGTEQKRPKIGVIFIIISLVGLVATAIVAVVLVVGKKNNDTTILGDVQGSFNRYANYLLIGEANTDEAGKGAISLDDSAFLTESDQESSEKKDQYYNNLLSYYDTFRKAIASENISDENASFLDTYENELKIIAYYYAGINLNNTDILESYTSSGEEKTREIITETYSKYKDLIDINDENYYNVAVKTANAYLDIIDEYNKLGCLSGGVINYECIPDQADINDKNIAFSNSYLSKQEIIETATSDIFLGVFEIKEMVYSNGQDDEVAK